MASQVVFSNVDRGVGLTGAAHLFYIKLCSVQTALLKSGHISKGPHHLKFSRSRSSGRLHQV